MKHKRIVITAVIIFLPLTFYFCIPDIINNTVKDTPQLTFFKDESLNTLTVIDCNIDINWHDINMTATDNNNVMFSHSQQGILETGDTIYFNNNNIIYSDIIIRFRYIPTNTLIGIYELTSIQ